MTGSAKNNSAERVVAYVDGFNLYFGLRQIGLKSGLWLDIPKLMQEYLLPGQTLVATKYFTSRITGPPDKAKRQSVYLEALATRPQISMYFGQYQSNLQSCRKCGHARFDNREKMTDVNIAVELLKDAMMDRLDLAYLVSADSDLSAPIQAFRELWPSKRIITVFPPGRGSVQLVSMAHAKRRIRKSVVMACQMPDCVPGPDGHPKNRPDSWR